MRIGRANLAYIHDVLMTGIAVVLAMHLRVGDLLFKGYWMGAVLAVPLAMLAGAVIYRMLGLYRGVWRYASIPDLLQLIKAVTAVSIISVVALFLVNRLEHIPRSIPLIQWFVLIILLGGPRFAYRLLKDYRHARPRQGGRERTPLLLIGAGDGADQLIRALSSRPDAVYQVVGALDPKGKRVGRNIHGVPVLGSLDQLEDIVAEIRSKGSHLQRLVLTLQPSDMGHGLIRSLFDRAVALDLTLTRLPKITDFEDALKDGKLELQPIAVEDLLGRPPVTLDREAISGLIGGHRVLVTGAGGTIGGELTRQIAALEPAELVILEAGEFNLYAIDQEIRSRHPKLQCRTVLADVRDRDRIMRIFMETKPELVFHAAALKHVPLVEDNCSEGIMTNAIGSRNVADAARAAGVRAMVLISTDKAVNPTNVMGASKRIAEAYSQALDVVALADETGAKTRFMTVRFGNVLGSSGSVVPLFQRQLAAGGPLTVTHPEMRRYFMTVQEAVELVLQASAHGWRHPDQRGRIFVLDMGQPVKIVDLARQMIRLAGLEPEKDVQIVFTGLRPGEKLYEEIFLPSEASIKTEADGIYLASPRIIDYAILNRAIGELEAAARSGDEQKMLAIVGNLVPEFRRTVVQAPLEGSGV